MGFVWVVALLLGSSAGAAGLPVDTGVLSADDAQILPAPARDASSGVASQGSIAPGLSSLSIPWTGSWAVDHVYPTQVSVAVPATLRTFGEPAPDGSQDWSYTLIALPSGPFYSCSYVAGFDEGNVGRGELSPGVGSLGLPGTCTLRVFPQDSLFEGHALATFASRFCTGAADGAGGSVLDVLPLLACDEVYGDDLLDTFEFGVFRIASQAPLATPPDAVHGVGDWFWEMALVNGDVELTKDTSDLLLDPTTAEWKLLSSRGDLYCFELALGEHRVFFLPTSQMWSPLVGQCSARHPVAGPSPLGGAEVGARFGVGVAGPLDGVAVALGGCGTFHIVGDGELVDAGALEDTLLPQVEETEDGHDVDWLLPSFLTGLVQQQLNPARCGGA